MNRHAWFSTAHSMVRDLDQATQRFGLATTSGGCPTVGVAGLTLSGGEGLLMSKYGAACDNLISAQLVTVDGRQVEASQAGLTQLGAEDQRFGIACCSSKQDSRFLRSTGTRACEFSGAALRYWTGHEIDCPNSRAARNGQYGSRRSSRAMMTASACPV